MKKEQIIIQVPRYDVEPFKVQQVAEFHLTQGQVIGLVRD